MADIGYSVDDQLLRYNSFGIYTHSALISVNDYTRGRNLNVTLFSNITYFSCLGTQLEYFVHK